LGWTTVSLSSLDVLLCDMSVTGLCEICERPSSQHSCDKCGKLVCQDHHDEETGVCTKCLTELDGDDRRRQPTEDMPDGVDTYEF
jgi:hypothetical protein